MTEVPYHFFNHITQKYFRDATQEGTMMITGGTRSIKNMSKDIRTKEVKINVNLKETLSGNA
jgi:hypothetical protein